MTDEEVKKRIATALGWTELHLSEAGELVGKKPGSEWHQWRVPDFTGSLDAMHKVEKSDALQEAFKKRSDFLGYEDVLADVVMNGKYPPRMGREEPYVLAITATARQRAESFLRTIGGWDE